MEAPTGMIRARQWLARCRRARALVVASATLAAMATALSGCAIEIPLNPAKTPPPARSPAPPAKTAERSLYGAEDALLQSRVRIVSDYIALNKALGGGWDGDVDALTPAVIDVNTEPHPAGPIALRSAAL
uniref:Uncharacterized protein n=1 Tax=Rhodopseudomonas palustris (strain BisA53) TaxID=316055 RepID=Q07LC3_RHOP5